MVREFETIMKNYTFLSGTTCYCILDLMDSRLVLKKSTWSNKLYQPKLHCYTPLVVIFQKVSSQNSNNRQQQKTKHLMGSKNFSQCSYEQVIITYSNLNLSLYAVIMCWIVFWLIERRRNWWGAKRSFFFGRPLTQNRANGQILCQLKYMWVNLLSSLFF